MSVRSELPETQRIQPSKPSGFLKNVVLLLSFWLGIAFTMYAYGLVMFGWAAVIVGASRQEWYEHLDFLSVPLGWVNRNFVIRPERSLLTVCGIILCNSYFYALMLLPIYKIVHAALYRGRVTQLGISQSISPNEDDEI